MTRYSVQPTDQMFVKDHGFLSLAKNMGKNIGKNISKNLSGKYSPGMLPMCQEPLYHTEKPATDVFRTGSKRATPKTAEATGDLIGNKIANKILTVSKNSQQNNSQTDTNENNKEMSTKILKERYISPQEKRNNIDNLRSIIIA